MKVYRICYDCEAVVSIEEYEGFKEAAEASKLKPHSAGKTDMQKAADLAALSKVNLAIRLFLAERRVKELEVLLAASQASPTVVLGPVGQEEVEAVKKDPKKFFSNGRPRQK